MKNLHKTLTIIAFLLSTTVFSTQAALITFSPENQDVNLGNEVSVNVTVADLLDTVSVGAFNFFVDFDHDKLTLNDVIFGDELDLFGFGSLRNDPIAELTGNIIEIAETSFDLPEDLIDLQSDDFTLFTLVFDTVKSGVASIALTGTNTLGDQDYLGLDFNHNSATIDINAPTTGDGAQPVPEPSLFLLISMAIVILIVRRNAQS